MDNCCCNTSSKLPVRLPAFAPDEKLAFVERVCGLLIESRYGTDRRFVPLDALGKASGIEADELDALLDCSQPRFARPPAPSKLSSPPATLNSREGERASIALSAIPFPSTIPLARGSPNTVPF